MLSRCLPALALAGLVCAVPPVSAQDQPAAGAALEKHEVRAWLIRIHEAASQRNFQGTFVVSAGGAVSSARITHYHEGRSQFERIDALDGQMRRVFRHDDLVHTLWPHNRVAVVEQRELMNSFPALLREGEDGIVDSYDVRTLGPDRVAGREAQVLQLSPRDELRFGYRLWADRGTGLLLRSEVVGTRDEVLESSAFSEVTIGIKPQPESVLKPMGRLDGYRVIRPTLTRTRLDAEGWALRAPVAGFRQVSCVKRPLDATGPDEGEIPDVLQAIYSDGLTYVSVFIEAYDAKRHERSVNTALGATGTVMRRHGDWWITVVGDVPAATLGMFVAALERRK